MGLLEVEGGRFQYTAEKIGRFFNAEYPEFNSLKFAILVAYTYKLVGRGVDKKLPLVEGQLRDQKALAEIMNVTATYPAKSVIVVTLDKEYEQQVPEVRARSWPYRGRPSVITGILYQGGQEIARKILYERR